MVILYSDDTKENNHTKIEDFLLTSQTSLGNTFDTNKTNKINYTILNSNITKIISESKADLYKLHKNYLVNLDKGLVNEPIHAEIFTVVDFEYISNILYGRLLRIISKNDLVNNQTMFTGISYDLAKDLINRYNYQKYLLNKSSYNSFSRFKYNHKDLVLDSDDP